MHFLIVEDDELARLSLESLLIEYGKVLAAKNLREAKKLLEINSFDMAFIDLDLESDLEGFIVLEKSVEQSIYSIILSGREGDNEIRRAYENGCHDYLAKPFRKKDLELVIKKFTLIHDKGILKNFFSTSFITQNDQLINHLDILKEIIISEKAVFIGGESGTGKTVLAEFIHQMTRLQDRGNFISLNCSEIPENLIESELFGYVKGAFSGALNDRIGKIEMAHNGILFLDEIATMPIILQKKLLKVIDEKKICRLGSNKIIEVDFRLISATCEDLREKVRSGSFREDLFYRIEGFNIFLPSLRMRKDDIPMLIKYFMGQGSRRVILTKEALAQLENYHWPGNIRELKKCVGILQSKGFGIVDAKDLPEKIINQNKSLKDEELLEILTHKQLEFIENNGLKLFLEKVEIQAVKHFYNQNSNKVRQTLEQIKISNSSFYRIMDKINNERGNG